MLVERGEVASTPWSRFMGLMGRRTLPVGYGLLLRNETAIHTFGMRIAIDVAYLDATGVVLRVSRRMLPARLGPLVRGVRDVLELPAGTLEQTDTEPGDHLFVEMA